MPRTLLLLLLPLFLWSSDYYYRQGQKVALSPMAESRSGDGDQVRYYRDASGRTLGVDDNLLFKVENGVDADALLVEYNLTLVKSLGYGLYVAKGTGSGQTLEIANRLYLDQRVRFAHPDFHMERGQR